MRLVALGTCILLLISLVEGNVNALRSRVLPSQNLTCPQNQVPITQSGQQTCVCDAGYQQYTDVNSKQISCFPCSEGTYNPTPGSTTCKPCPRGAGANSGSALGSKTCSCFAGYAQSGSGDSLVCEMCPANMFASAGDAYCAPCPPGAESVIGSGSCYCQGGFAQSGGGKVLSCTQCVNNAYTVYDTCKEGYTYTSNVRGSSRGESPDIVGGCFKFVQNGQIWQSAAFMCDQYANGWLVTINNGGANNYIANLGGIATQKWIGYNDIAYEGKFTWIHGPGMGYTNWAPGQPNDGTDGANQYPHQNCVMTGWTGNELWNDFYCTPMAAPFFLGVVTSLSFVCESDLITRCVPCPANSVSIYSSCQCNKGYVAVGTGVNMVCQKVIPGAPTPSPSSIPTPAPSVAPTTLAPSACPYPNSVKSDGACLCQAGYSNQGGGYIAGQLSMDCVLCGANTFSLVGAPGCSPCPANSHSSAGASACTCNEGFTTVGTGYSLQCLGHPTPSPTEPPPYNGYDAIITTLHSSASCSDSSKGPLYGVKLGACINTATSSFEFEVLGSTTDQITLLSYTGNNCNGSPTSKLISSSDCASLSDNVQVSSLSYFQSTATYGQTAYGHYNYPFASTGPGVLVTQTSNLQSCYLLGESWQYLPFNVCVPTGSKTSYMITSCTSTAYSKVIFNTPDCTGTATQSSESVSVCKSIGSGIYQGLQCILQTTTQE